MKSYIKKVKYREIVTPKLKKGAAIRSGFPGFKEDYLALHCLLRKNQIKSVLEIGTSSGLGTRVICNALGLHKFYFWRNFGKKVVSIDVLPGTNPKIIYPEGEDGHPQVAGELCDLPYTQLFGDSTKYDFSPEYPLEAWFVDGKHNYEYAKKDTTQALKSSPKLIIWHDKQIKGVKDAILDIMRLNSYDVFDLEKTRLIFAIRREA